MNDTAGLRLSVLDTVPVWNGVPAARSLRELLDLAPAVERLGYHRYWLAEHHNMPAFGTSTPPVLIGQLAQVTSTMRIGSGGVMLPNHVPYVVAEQFATLDVFHPDRIDLGVGRAPGGEPATARALRRTGGPAHEGGFGDQLTELLGYLTPSGAGGRPPVAVCPPPERPVPVWLLGTSPSSASLAARLGLPYAYANHLNPAGTEAAVARYREEFRPSEHLAQPYVAVSAQVVAAGTDEEAEYLAGPIKVAHVEGRINPLTLFRTPEQAAEYGLTEEQRSYLDGHFAPQIVGGPQTVRRRLADFRARTGADELLATAPVFGLEARIRTFRLLAEAAGQPAAAGAGEVTPATSASSS
ncbi:LLM class flavin-dependent oxidoreductase [Streptomyces sp. DR3-1]|uniref:LLM class flavin-dependent oxidoreductase n=1 Tax=Streptomyces sp. DR3-1 TaxID=2951169 RepID=UPI0020431743|nr:LLM class flavin-dependent oxidoreductase [Streptomyces sp. DR3-1]MCM3822389.1 LLM class flavin-dependent oxidoreductase [Streptomyces sp. DR3-1]